MIITPTLTILPTLTVSANATIFPTITPTNTPYPEGTINVYPDPARLSHTGYVKFSNLPIDALVNIYTLNGEMVTFYKPQAPVLLWPCKNSIGNKNVPGYLLLHSRMEQITLKLQ